jgi:methionyl-tRNA formyltransferase
MLKKEDGLIDWSRPATQIHNQVRGLDPWPGAYTWLSGEVLKLAGTSPATDTGAPGPVLASSASGVLIACGKGSLLVQQLQLPGKRRLAAADFLRGRALPPGTRLGQ